MPGAFVASVRFLVAAVCLLLPCGVGSEPLTEAVKHYENGRQLRQMRDYRGAAAAFEQAVAADSTYGDAHFALAGAYKTLSQFDRAIRAFETAGVLGVSDEHLQARIPDLLADAYSKWGLKSFKERKFREAVAAFEKSLGAKPDDAHIHYNVGLCYTKLHENEAARTAFERALQIDPNYLKPYKSLGDIQRREREFGLAERTYEKAIAIDSTYIDARAGLARVQLATGAFDAAAATLGRVVAIDPSHADGHLLLGYALNQLQRYHEAEEPLRRAIDLDSDNAEAHYRLAQSYYGTGEYRRAVKAGLVAVGRRRDFHPAEVVLADSYAELGQMSDASAWYLKAREDSRFRDYCSYRLDAIASTAQ